MLNFLKKLKLNSDLFSLFKNIFKVSFLSVFVYVIYGLQEIILAWKFGVSESVDVFVVVFTLISFLVSVFSESFCTALIPTYIQVKNLNNEQLLKKLSSTILLLGLSIFLLISLLALITSPLYFPLLTKGFNHDQLILTKTIFYILLPLVIFKGIRVLLTSFLQAQEKFTVSSILPGITPLIVLLLLYFSKKSWDIVPVAIGFVIGSIVEIIVLSPYLKKHRLVFSPRLFEFNEYSQQIIKGYLPMIAGAFLMSSTRLVDQAMAATLGSGSVAALNYGGKLVSFSLVLISFGLGTVILPYFSQQIAKQDWNTLKSNFKRILLTILGLSFILTIILIIFSTQLIQLVFQKGEFTLQDVLIVSNIQICYALQMPFYLGGIVVVRLISSLQANHILMQATFYNLIANILLNYLFMKIWGVAGIALSTSVVYLISFIFCLIKLKCIVFKNYHQS